VLLAMSVVFVERVRRLLDVSCPVEVGADVLDGGVADPSCGIRVPPCVLELCAPSMTVHAKTIAIAAGNPALFMVPSWFRLLLPQE
jgi:hypothetical protein